MGNEKTNRTQEQNTFREKYLKCARCGSYDVEVMMSDNTRKCRKCKNIMPPIKI